MPQAIPADIAPRLVRLHGHPFVWWVGQFIKYLFRPQPWLQEDIKLMKEKLGFKNPIVGLAILLSIAISIIFTDILHSVCH